MPKWSDGNTDVANRTSSRLSRRGLSGLRGEMFIGNSLVPSNRSSLGTTFAQSTTFVIKTYACTHTESRSSLSTCSESPCTRTRSKRTCFSTPDCSSRMMLKQQSVVHINASACWPIKFTENSNLTCASCLPCNRARRFRHISAATNPQTKSRCPDTLARFASEIVFMQ